MRKKFSIEVDCAACAAKIEAAAQKVPGVRSASVSFMSQKLLVEAPDDAFDAAVDAIERAAKKIEPDFVLKR